MAFGIHDFHVVGPHGEDPLGPIETGIDLISQTLGQGSGDPVPLPGQDQVLPGPSGTVAVSTEREMQSCRFHQLATTHLPLGRVELNGVGLAIEVVGFHQQFDSLTETAPVKALNPLDQRPDQLHVGLVVVTPFDFRLEFSESLRNLMIGRVTP